LTVEPKPKVPFQILLEILSRIEGLKPCSEMALFIMEPPGPEGIQSPFFRTLPIHSQFREIDWRCFSINDDLWTSGVALSGRFDRFLKFVFGSGATRAI
jgi:hypothetical protein